MPSYYIIFSGVLSNLTETGYSRFKQKCSQHMNYFRESKERPLTKALFDAAFSPSVIQNISREQLQEVFNAVFPMRVRYIVWFDTYCEILCRAYNGLYGRIAGDGRAIQYFKHLFHTLIPEFRNVIKNEDGKSDFVNRLIEINKILSCLNRYAYNDNSSFSMNTDHDSLKNMESQIVGYLNNHMGEYEYRERVYVNLICWIIEELICEQDGVAEEEGEDK